MNEYILKNIQDTRIWATEFAKTLYGPQTVALYGELGMGKSEIARTIIQALRGMDTVVPSPTFTIVQNYDGISHFDLYRIKDATELEELGLTHAMQNDITIIEWPEIATSMLPDNTIHVFLDEYNGGRKILVKKQSV